MRTNFAPASLARGLLVLALACQTLPARADIYAGRSADGVPVFSDRPDDGLRWFLETSDLPHASMGRLSTPEKAGVGMRRHARQIELAAAEQGLEPALVHAVIQVESGYDARAVSPKGATGLMQLMPSTARRLGVVDSRDPLANLRGGTRYLRDLLATFGGNLSLALAAYNAGEAAVRRHAMSIPPYAETTAYVHAVLRRYALLKNSI